MTTPRQPSGRQRAAVELERYAAGVADRERRTAGSRPTRGPRRPASSPRSRARPRSARGSTSARWSGRPADRARVTEPGAAGSSVRRRASPGRGRRGRRARLGRRESEPEREAAADGRWTRGRRWRAAGAAGGGAAAGGAGGAGAGSAEASGVDGEWRWRSLAGRPLRRGRPGWITSATVNSATPRTTSRTKLTSERHRASAARPPPAAGAEPGGAPRAGDVGRRVPRRAPAPPRGDSPSAWQ